MEFCKRECKTTWRRIRKKPPKVPGFYLDGIIFRNVSLKILRM